MQGVLDFDDREQCTGRTFVVYEGRQPCMLNKAITEVRSWQGRMAWPDYARGIAIVLVLFRHLLDGLKRAGMEPGPYHWADVANIYLSGSRIPVFFIIAGLFTARALKKKKLTVYLRERTGIILYPYLVWGSLQVLCQIMLPQWVNAQRNPADLLKLFYLPRQIDQFWYLYALFNVTLLYSISRASLLSKDSLQLVLGLFLFFLGAFLQTQAIELGFVKDILHYYLFFVIGCMVSEYLLDREHFSQLASRKFLLVSSCSFLVIQGSYFYLEAVHDENYFVYFISQQPFYFLMMSLSGAALMVSLSFWMEKKNLLPILKKLGEYSLYIYIWHVFFMAGSRIVLINLLHIRNIHLLIFCGMLSGIILPVLMFIWARNAGIYWLFRASRLESAQGSKKAYQWLNA